MCETSCTADNVPTPQKDKREFHMERRTFIRTSLLATVAVGALCNNALANDSGPAIKTGSAKGSRASM